MVDGSKFSENFCVTEIIQEIIFEENKYLQEIFAEVRSSENMPEFSSCFTVHFLLNKSFIWTNSEDSSKSFKHMKKEENA